MGQVQGETDDITGRQTKRMQAHKNAQQLRRDCAPTSTSTLWINGLDSHRLVPETR